jgi:hypothetical protein
MSNNYEYIVFNLLYNCFVFSAIIVFNGNADADKKNQRTGNVDMCKRSFS